MAGQMFRVCLWLQVFSSTEEIDTILKCLPTSDEMIKLQPYLQGILLYIAPCSTTSHPQACTDVVVFNHCLIALLLLHACDVMCVQSRYIVMCCREETDQRPITSRALYHGASQDASD